MNPKVRKLRLVQVGVGMMGSVWLSLIKNRKDIEIVGLSDIDTVVIKRLKNEFESSDVLIDKDFKQLITKLKPDFVLDVTPPKVRSKNLTFYVKNDINILSEKPLVQSKKGLDDVVLSMTTSKSKLMISQNYRWSTSSNYLKKIIKNNEYGKIKSVNITYSSNYKTTGWRSKTKNVFILDMAVHHLDLIRYITNKNFKSIRCDSGHITKVNGLLDENVNFEYSGTWKSKSNFTSRAGKWIIRMEQATILWDGDYNITVISSNKNKNIKVKPEVKDKLDISMDKYVNYINGTDQKDINLEDNKHTLEAVFACILSNKLKKTIYL